MSQVEMSQDEFMSCPICGPPLWQNTYVPHKDGVLSLQKMNYKYK